MAKLARIADNFPPESDPLKLVTEAAPAVLFTSRWNGHVEYVNKAFYDYTGMPEGSALGFGWLQCIQPDDLQKMREAMLRATRTFSSPEAVEHRIRMADGSYRWFIGRARAVRERNGRIRLWVGSCADIDDRKRAEQALNDSEERLKLALQASSAGTWEWDLLDGTVTWSNEYYDVMGIPRGTPPSYQAWLDAVDEAQREAVDAAMRKASEEHADIEIEHRSPQRDGTVRWISARGRVTWDERGRPTKMRGIVLDITERKRAEEELLRQQEAIRALSTPVLEVSPRLLIVPLIGAVDARRAAQLTHQVLREIRNRRARAVVVDITGVAEVDEQAANNLIQTAEAARLLGANVIITGVSRQVAQTLVNLGVDLSALDTMGDLRSGIEKANRVANESLDRAA